MSEEVSKYHIKNDTGINKSKFAANHIKAVAEWSWWKNALKRTLLKEFNLTGEDFNEIQSTPEYKERVLNLMLENRSAEEFEEWVSRYGDNMPQRFGEIMGLEPEHVPDMVEQVRQAHAKAKALESETRSSLSMHAYVVILHLVSQGYSTFIEMRNVLCREDPGTYYITILAYIVKKIAVLEDEWSESIPPITALVFNSDGNASKWACQEFTGSDENQPTLQQITELAASVAAYENWDKVVEAFRKDAFSD